MLMRIRELREMKGMTQQQLADSMGVIRNAVSNWETEVSLPKTRQLPTLAKVFDVSIGELFADDMEAADLCVIPS